MWSWVLHRITGVAIFFFLLVHVLDTALIRVSPEAYDAVIGTYKNPVMALGEVVLVAGIVFHAMNGLRIILVDFCFPVFAVFLELVPLSMCDELLQSFKQISEEILVDEMGIFG